MQVRTSFFSLKRTAGLLGASALMTAAIVPAHAQTLGKAADYNVFIFGDQSAKDVDVQGKVAVGGNANYTNYTVADKQATGSGVNLVVGGNYTNSNGSVNGSVVVGGNITHSVPSISGNVSAKGSVDFSGSGGTVTGAIVYGTTYAGPSYLGTSQTKGTTTLPFDFAQVQADLTSKSTSFAALTPTTTATLQSNQLYITAAATGQTVVNVTAAQLAAATNGFVYSGSANSTLLINITNPTSLASLTIANTGTTFSGGLAMANLLYNIADPTLTTINLQGSFVGSLLAPKATINATTGGFNGQLIANKLNGGGEEFHSVEYGTGSTSTYFKGTVSANTNNSVPEPGSLALAGLGLPVALGAIRRRAKRA